MARVIPIILRPADWLTSPIGKLQALPRDGRPITMWQDRDAALLDVTQGIRQVAEDLKSQLNRDGTKNNSVVTPHDVGPARDPQENITPKLMPDDQTAYLESMSTNSVEANPPLQIHESAPNRLGDSNNAIRKIAESSSSNDFNTSVTGHSATESSSGLHSMSDRRHAKPPEGVLMHVAKLAELSERFVRVITVLDNGVTKIIDGPRH